MIEQGRARELARALEGTHDDEETAAARLGLTISEIDPETLLDQLFSLGVGRCVGCRRWCLSSVLAADDRGVGPGECETCCEEKWP